MKINENYVVKNIVGETVIVPTGKAAQYFNGLISTNEVAGFIWENIEQCDAPEQMIELVCNEFDGDKEIIKTEVMAFLNNLKQANMIEF